MILYLRSYPTVCTANKDARRICYSLTLYEHIYYSPLSRGQFTASIITWYKAKTRVNILV